MKTIRKKRLIILASHPVQYQAPLFRLLHQSPYLDVVVYYCWDFGVKNYFEPDFGLHIKWDISLLNGYKYIFLRNLSPKPSASFWGQINPGIINVLVRDQYDALLIHGYTTFTSWLALLSARLIGTPVIFRGEGDLLRPISRRKQVVKKILLRWLFKRVDAVLYSCTANADYYRFYGVPKQKMFFAPSAVDNTFFQEQARHLKPERCKIKQELGIPCSLPVILTASKLIRRKRPLDVLRAFEKVQDKGVLVFVGDGPERKKLEKFVESRHIRNVYFAGFINQSEISRFYAIADIFVLASEWDPSPKALQEVMNFAVAVILSDRVGTAFDLVKEGENGFIYPVGNVEILSEHLTQLLENPELRESMGKKSLEIVSEWNYEGTFRGILEAVKYVVAKGMR
ncbi:glycosyltransferase family 4 protein [Candidatus Bipolaricaulota sp. J31]